jgi:hypothetical protein
LGPAPPDIATFKKLAEFWPAEIACNLGNAPDDVKAKFAEMFDLQATIRPDGSQNGYHIDLSANITLEMEGDKPGACNMMSRASALLFHHKFICLTPASGNGLAIEGARRLH